MGSGSEEIVFETRFDHPPAQEALEANKPSDTKQTERHGLRYVTASDKIKGGKDEGEAYGSAPESVNPLHPVD